MSSARALLTTLERRILGRTGYAVVWRDPRGYSLATHLMAVFEQLGVNCVLDVGAHVGEYGRLLRRHGYRGRIVSFEPVGESFERLEEAGARDADWLVRHVALGREDGEAEINLARDSTMSSFLEAGPARSEKQGAAIAPVGREPVTLSRLDSVLEECVAGLDEPRIFLKMDTQGWDREVLAGAEGSLDRILGIQSEVSVLPLYEGMASYLDALREFHDLGFALTGIYPVVRIGMNIVELDVVLIRGDDGRVTDGEAA
jgi:FkbM family methyltransferase